MNIHNHTILKTCFLVVLVISISSTSFSVSGDEFDGILMMNRVTTSPVPSLFIESPDLNEWVIVVCQIEQQVQEVNFWYYQPISIRFNELRLAMGENEVLILIYTHNNTLIWIQSFDVYYEKNAPVILESHLYILLFFIIISIILFHLKFDLGKLIRW